MKKLLAVLLLFGVVGMSGPRYGGGWTAVSGTVWGDLYFEYTFDWLSVRTTFSLIDTAPATFFFGPSLMITPPLGPMELFVGGGPGVTVSGSGGALSGIFTFEALLGVTFPWIEYGGVSLGARFIGQVSGGTVSGFLAPQVSFFLGL